MHRTFASRCGLLLACLTTLLLGCGDDSNQDEANQGNGGAAASSGKKVSGGKAGAGAGGKAAGGAGAGGSGAGSGGAGAAGAGAGGEAGSGGASAGASGAGTGGAGTGGAGSGGAGSGGAGQGGAGQGGQGGQGGGNPGGQGGGNPGGGGQGGGTPVCVAPEPTPVPCVDLTDLPGSWTTAADDGAASKVTLETSGSWGSALSGKAARVETASGFMFRARLQLDTPVSAGASNVVQLAVRAKNDNPNGWQINGPVLVLEDASGKRRTLSPSTQHLPSDGASWKLVEAPLGGGSGWDASGDAIDMNQIRAVEIAADTWDAGFWFVVDSLSFRAADDVCQMTCPNDCGGGKCLESELRCVCPVGASGEGCQTCAPGFEPIVGGCKLVDDGDFDEWPNAVSRANSDPWLQVHEGEIRKVKPRVLVVHFPNHKDGVPTSDIGGSTALVQSVIAGFREGSRPRGYADPSAAPQLEYELVKVVDARDGVQGRPPAPPGFPYENSTLYPRTGEGAGMKLDYSAFFGETFAKLYDIEAPDAPGKKLTLCELIDRGLVHELWMVGSGDVPDAPAFEVLESKQRYTPDGNKIPNSFDLCAGNGCFEPTTPICNRSVRIGFVNYTRGPGCYLHSQGHGIESFGQRGVVPRLSDWFVPFANFDLGSRYGLPVSNFYGVECANEPCISMPAPDALSVTHKGATHNVAPYDARCGNVHFPPNAQDDYDDKNPTEVLTSCQGFGRHGEGCGKDQKTLVSAETWAKYEPLSPDCSGAYLVWWFQNMPAYGSGQSFSDGRPMTSIWPALFY